MHSFDKLAAITSTVLVLLCVAANVLLFSNYESTSKEYNVDINRAEQELMRGNEVSASDYENITAITIYDGSEDFYNAKGDNTIRLINGTLYRFDHNGKTVTRKKPVLKTELCLAGVILLYILTMLYLRQRIIKPFTELSQKPAELAKGNLAIPLKEHKSKYFGKFIWGMDMLRERLEKSRIHELEHIKDEKTQLLSLSHDIKTPLSAIKLYSSAISRGLYSTPEKQTEAAGKISAKADEIEGYVKQMIHDLSEDPIPINVIQGEFYFSEVISRINRYYSDKLTSLSARLITSEAPDCILKGDPDRLEEVLQNILENAVKYGDGKDITISFSDEEDRRLITVTNGGCTLPEEEMSHIFNSFWRGSNTDGKPGSGLGLYICRRLMNAMDGDIFAEQNDGDMSVTAVCRKA